MKKAIVIMLVFSVTAATSAFGGSRQSEVYDKETKSFDMEPGGYVDIQADDGYIRINTWDQDRVEVVMNKRAWGRNQATGFIFMMSPIKKTTVISACWT